MARENPFRTALGIGVRFPGPGRAELTMEDCPANRGDDGRVAQGAILTLLDIALGHAVAARLPEPSSFATVSLQVVLRADWTAGPLVARGSAGVLAPGWRDAVAEGSVATAGGQLVATAQGAFARSGSGAVQAAASAEAAATATSFRELLQWQAADGGLTMEVRRQHLNPDGVLHGGAMAALLDAGMWGALRRLGAGDLRLLSFSIRYLLPARPGTLAVAADVERHGRRIHFARATARDGEGRLLAAADATYVEPGL